MKPPFHVERTPAWVRLVDADGSEVCGVTERAPQVLDAAQRNLEEIAVTLNLRESWALREAELMAALYEAVDFLIWCSGSSDFAPGGKAREGWVLGPQRFIERFHRALPRP